MSNDDAFLVDTLGRNIGDTPTGQIGIAVSGGSDSTALLHLMHRWAAKAGVQIKAATVDHGLRAAAAEEAVKVADMCRDLGVEHSILRWAEWDRKGNLQDQARRARYGLIRNWAQVRGIDTVVLGHTLDDQAETFLMRLARGSGVDGLSGMAMRRHDDGVVWLRPVLTLRRQQLRDFLLRHGISWIDDPSNEDETYDRVKARRILKALDPLGIDADRLAGTARDLQHARHALEIQTAEAARRVISIENFDVVTDSGKFSALPAEIRSRLLSHSLCWLSSAQYRPRRNALRDVEQAIEAGRTSTLHGCLITVNKTEIRITRELQAVKDTVCPTDAVWDNRWRFEGPHEKGLELRALGESGLAQCPDWRDTGMPRVSLISGPAVWEKDRLIAAPLAGMGNGWRTKALFGLDHFISSIISH